MAHRFLPATLAASLAVAGCTVVEATKADDPRFPLARHALWPLFWPSTGQTATGAVSGTALEQPIPFSHFVHASELQIDCQYCHSEARRSLHAGVPPVQACMGCHVYCKTDSPEVQKIHQAWCGQPKCTVREDGYGQPVREPNGAPIAWSKVHDLPDYVHFNHSRHIQGGVQCSECHGQAQLQGQYTKVQIPGAPEGQTYRQVDEVMVREASLQMGWCLDCHGSHPSIDQNYGDKADLRRAELKDCWTCHK